MASITEIYCLPVLEARSLRSRSAGFIPSESCEKESAQVSLLASVGVLAIFGILGLCHSDLCFYVHVGILPASVPKFLL